MAYILNRKCSLLQNVRCNSYVVQNKFIVKQNKSYAFENFWAHRQSNLKTVPGVESFLLIKNEKNEKNEKNTEYISHTLWADKDSFLTWLKSPEFFKSHQEDKQNATLEILESQPTYKTYNILESYFIDNIGQDKEYQILYEKYYDEPSVNNLTDIYDLYGDGTV